MSGTTDRPDLSWFVELNGDLVQAIYGTYGDRITALLEEEGIEGWHLHGAQVALHHDGPLDAGSPVFAPYGALEARQANLRATAELGLLDAVDGGYVVTERGRELLARVIGEIDAVVGAAPAPAAPVARAAEILGPQVRRCEECDFPTPHLGFGRNFEPGPGAPPLVRLRRMIFDLNLFRDDAHEAAFDALGVPAEEWEAFSHVEGSHVWGDPVSTAAEVSEKLSFRGHDEAAYQTALERAVGRGWLTRDGDRYTATDEGRRIRTAVEADTDARFFGPWRLSGAEAVELRRSMEAVKAAFGADDEDLQG